MRQWRGRFMVLCGARIGSSGLGKGTLPAFQGIVGDNRGSRAVEAVGFGDSLTDKPGRKSGKRQEKVTIESKGTVCPGIAEADDLDLDRKILPVQEEIEGTPVDEMAPYTAVRISLVVKELETESLPGIRGRNFFLE